MNIDKVHLKKSLLKYLPFFILFAIIFTWHFTLPRFGDEVMFAKMYHKQNIFNYLTFRYETWSSRLLIEFFVLPFSALPRVIWNFFDSIVFLLIAVLIPQIAFNIKKIDEKRLFIYNSLSCVIVLLYIFTTSRGVLGSAGYIATTLNYTWPLFFVLLHFYLVKKYLFNDNNASKKQKIAIYAVMLFALIFSINQEMMLLLVSEVYFFMILYCLYNKVKIPNTIFFMLLIISLDFLYVYSCPGNHLRYSHEILHWFPDYYKLTLVNKIDLGITPLLNRIVLLYSLINLFFFGILGVYVYSITKKKIPIVISLIPLMFVVTLGVMNLMGYTPLIGFMKAGITKYGLLHSNLKHILINSSIYAIMIFSVIYSLIRIYKHGKRRLSFIIFCLLILGFTSQMIRGFSPTVWGGGQRWEIYYYFCIACATYLLSVDLLESKYDSCKKWLMTHKL